MSTCSLDSYHTVNCVWTFLSLKRLPGTQINVADTIVLRKRIGLTFMSSALLFCAVYVHLCIFWWAPLNALQMEGTVSALHVIFHRAGYHRLCNGNGSVALYGNISNINQQAFLWLMECSRKARTFRQMLETKGPGKHTSPESPHINSVTGSPVRRCSRAASSISVYHS